MTHAVRFIWNNRSQWLLLRDVVNVYLGRFLYIFVTSKLATTHSRSSWSATAVGHRLGCRNIFIMSYSARKMSRRTVMNISKPILENRVVYAARETSRKILWQNSPFLPEYMGGPHFSKANCSAEVESATLGDIPNTTARVWSSRWNGRRVVNVSLYMHRINAGRNDDNTMETTYSIRYAKTRSYCDLPL